MTIRSYVQVAADGAGKKVANVANGQPQPVDTSGNAVADVTDYQQLVTLASERGDVLEDPTSQLGELVAAQHRTNELLELVLAALS